MKIIKIELKGYNQFKDVVIDLTYPQGHDKEGKPLDKVCIIGQSGSGKTTLLRLIKWFVSLTRDVGKNVRLPVPPENGVKMDIRLFDITYRMCNTKEFPYFHFDWDSKIEELDFFQLLRGNFKKINPLLFNFPTEVITGDNGHGVDRSDTLEMLEKIKAAQVSPYMNKLNLGRFIDFAVGDVNKTLENILEDIKKHQEQELLFNNQIATAASPKDAARKKSEFNKWLEHNPNPLALMAEHYLDDILFYLGLKVKRDIDKDTISHLGSIQLQTLAGRYVPGSFWSTGTRHLVETTVPLYKLKPQNAVILIDEPERSLYPDIQKSIIDTYVTLAPGCQFFFATHSPIIASSFEPWEIVELKFDDEHKYVYRDLHYEGENHVDNYKYFPEYLRWDSILERIFELEEEGGKKRLKALEKLAEVDIRIGKMKEKGQLNSPEGKKLVKEFKVLSQRVDWEY
ncbi:MAG: AAA family ATPase [Candidatus Aminicenantes bacterium]|nr:MAG: AAA family ATPase [Candidatus Aminicenantes bacterium]